MASGQTSAFQAVPAQVGFDPTSCPTCGRDIPPDKLEEIGGRIAARVREHTTAITAQVEKQYAAERARAEARAKADLESERVQSAVREARVRDEAQKAAATLLRERLAEAEKTHTGLVAGLQQQLAEAQTAQKSAQQMSADLQAEKNELREQGAKALADAQAAAKEREMEIRNEARRAAEAAVAERIAAIHAAQCESEIGLKVRIDEAEAGRIAAEEKFLVLTSQHETSLNELRDVLEKAKEDAVNAERARAFEEAQRLSTKVSDLQRALDNKTAEELGEGAQTNLFEALRVEFPDDKISQIAKGAPGADIVHVVMCRGEECGSILYDSKNHKQFRWEHVTKLKADQLAAKAEHAILSTHKFPQDTHQLHIHEGVILANPARVVAVVTMVRQHLLQLHTLRVSDIERERKTAVLYEFITSERCSQLLARIDERADDLLKRQDTEIKWHQNNWKKQGEAIRDIQKAKIDLKDHIDSIIGASEGDCATSEAS